MPDRKKSNVLVVAAHPDDEALGCGGTLALHAKQGDYVHALFMTNGVGARGSDQGAQERRAACENATKALGISSVTYNDFPDNKMDSVALLDIVKKIETVIKEIQPAIIYTHHSGDLNIDHEITSRAVLTACRPLPGHSVQAIYGFEVPSSTEWAGPSHTRAFLPSHFVEITTTFEAKKKSLSFYNMEMHSFPHPRSHRNIEALATLRGSQVGVEKAEAFSTIRTMNKDKI